MLSVKVFFQGLVSVLLSPWLILGTILTITKRGLSPMRANSLIRLWEDGVSSSQHGLNSHLLWFSFHYLSSEYRGVCGPCLIEPLNKSQQ